MHIRKGGDKAMRWNKGNSLAIILIVVGSLMLLGSFTPVFGHLVRELMGYLIPVAMVALGYYGVKRGNTVAGWIILIIGLLILIGKLSWLIGPLLAIGLIFFGINMLKNRRGHY